MFWQRNSKSAPNISQAEFEAYKQGYAEEHEKRLALEKELVELRGQVEDVKKLRFKNDELVRQLEDVKFQMVELQIEVNNYKEGNITPEIKQDDAKFTDGFMSIEDLKRIEARNEAASTSDPFAEMQELINDAEQHLDTKSSLQTDTTSSDMNMTTDTYSDMDIPVIPEVPPESSIKMAVKDNASDTIPVSNPDQVTSGVLLTPDGNLVAVTGNAIPLHMHNDSCNDNFASMPSIARAAY